MNFNVLYKDEVTSEFQDYCRQNNIQIIAYQPIKRQEVLNNETLKEIAKTHNATPAQIALTWLLAQGVLSIPKAVNKTHIDENVNAVEIQLSEQELELLNK
jgi:diketogulonate reductase-like aldo/keto reductase